VSLAAFCGAPQIIAGGLFVAALVGSFVHCMPMCGPFLLMQIPAGQDGPALRRLAGGLLVRYQLGRLTTYVGLGALAGGVGQVLTFHWPLAALLAGAALVFLLQGLAMLLKLPATPLSRLGRLIVPLAVRQPGGYRLGLLLGFLPCGFLYSALAAAAATGGALPGALAMAAFALGTLPGLLLVALGGRMAFGRDRPAWLLAPVLLLNAAILSVAAIDLI